MFRLPFGEGRSGIPFYLISIYFTVALLFCQFCYYIYSLTSLLRISNEPIPIPRRRSPFHHRPDTPREFSEFVRAWNQSSQGSESFQEEQTYESFSVPSATISVREFINERSSDYTGISSQASHEGTLQSFSSSFDVSSERMPSTRERSSVGGGMPSQNDQIFQSFSFSSEVFSDRYSTSVRQSVRRSRLSQDSHEQAFQAFSVSSDLLTERTSSATDRSVFGRVESSQDSHEQTFQSHSDPPGMFVERTSPVRESSSLCRCGSSEVSQEQNFQAFSVSRERTSSARERTSFRRRKSSQPSHEQTFHSHSVLPGVFGERTSLTRERTHVTRGGSNSAIYSSSFPQSYETSHTCQSTRHRVHSARCEQFVNRSRLSPEVLEVISESRRHDIPIPDSHRSVSESSEHFIMRPDPYSRLFRERHGLFEESVDYFNV